MTRGDWVVGLLTVVIPALIGAGSALLTQRLSSRDSRANRRLQKRSELRETVHAFLEAVQDAEACADPASRGRGDRDTLLHRMYRKRALEVVAPRDLDAVENLTKTMRDVMFGALPVGQDMWDTWTVPGVSSSNAPTKPCTTRADAHRPVILFPKFRAMRQRSRITPVQWV